MEKRSQMNGKRVKKNLMELYVPPHRRHEKVENLCTSSSVLNRMEEATSGNVEHKVAKLANIFLQVQFQKLLPSIYKKEFDEELSPDLMKTLQFTVKLNQVLPENKIKNDLDLPSSVVQKLDYEKLGKEFWITIYSCESVAELWGIILDTGHFEEVEKLAESMKEYFAVGDFIFEEIVVGGVYALFDGSWHRVRCLKVGKYHATVFFIDRGDTDAFPKKKLRKLPHEFCNLPAQAIKLSLESLEIFEDLKDVKKILESCLLDKPAYVKVNRYYQDTLYCSLYLQNEDDEINLNSFLMEEIIGKLLHPIDFIELNEVIPCKVAYVSKKAVDTINHENYKTHTVVKLSGLQVYFVQHKEAWYRARVIRFVDENQVDVDLIDVGCRITVNCDDFILLEKICEVLAMYPPQAIKVDLDGLEGQILEKQVVSVQLFQKENDSLLSINDQIRHNDEQKASQTLHQNIPKNELSKSKSANNNQDVNKDYVFEEMRKVLTKIDLQGTAIESYHQISTLSIKKVLNMPKIPDTTFFDSHVVLSYDPSHFVIHMLSYRNGEFKDMVNKMAEVMEIYESPKLTYEIVQVGQMYAIKGDSDEQWYRVFLLKKCDKNSVFVYYCDYGEYKAVCINKLKVLHNRFYTVPYQAVWCELYGKHFFRMTYFVPDT
ncbi:tudor domain-containing protein 7-like [Copidosoma floridanum]|uniref:tudor domain-containing protein 7-like n=1 Tax=Copidosoma floridanum TaxID=29053 RepID=UPI0006C99319|nr:tudor domain-containing protein 7-like [Copidosoma floridanum]